MSGIRIGTRGSALALAQARLVQRALEQTGARCELVEIVTAGDVRQPDTAWGEGAFVGALEAALLDGRVDVAVHSAKDMPTDEDRRLRVVAYLPRADARDALVTRAGARVTLADLPAGSTIGTDSPRRAGFVRARRADLEVRPLHGNVDTRLRRLDEGQVDALILAAAGLERLGHAQRISQRFSAHDLPPAPGQGAIAVQARAEDERAGALGRSIDDRATRIAVVAERALLAATGGGCRAPVGALATVSEDGNGGEIRLLAGFATLDGRSSAVEEASGPAGDATRLARDLAARLVARRAELADRARVLVTRPADQSARLVARLAEHGLRAELVPAIAIRPPADTGPLEQKLRRLADYAWAVVTSANGARSVVETCPRLGVDVRTGRWAAVGRTTAAVLAEAGVELAWQPSLANAAAVGDELPIGNGDTLLLLQGNLADGALARTLRERGAEVHEAVAYETVEAPPASRPLLERAFDGDPPAALVLASPSAVRGILALAGDDLRPRVLTLAALCIGATTGAAAREHGFDRVVEAPDQDASALADLAAELIAGTAVVSQ